MPNGVTIDDLQIEISVSADKSTERIIQFIGTLTELKSVANGGIKGLNTITKQLNRLSDAINKIPDLSKLEQLKDIYAQISGIDIAKSFNVGSISEAMAQIQDTLGEAQRNMNNPVTETGTAIDETISSVSELTGEVDGLSGSVQTSVKSLDVFKGALKKVRSGAITASEGVWKFTESLKRIALYRIIRTILKAITQSLKEGIQNIAQYSGVANESLSRLSTTALTLKNSIGAAVITIIIAFTPILEGLGDAAIFVANSLNILFSTISGNKQITVAVSYWQDYTKSITKAKQALTGFDEINTLSKNDSTLPNYSEMFQDIDINVGDFMKSQLAIVGILAGIAAIVAFSKEGKFLTNLKDVGGVLLIISGSIETITSFISIWNDGATWETSLAMLMGLTLLVAGLGLEFGSTGVAIGLVIGSVLELTAGIKDMITNGMNIQNVTQVIEGIGMALAAVGVILLSTNAALGTTFIVVGAIVGVVALVISSFDEMSQTAKIVTSVIGGLVAVLSAAAIAALAANGALTFGVGAALAAAAIGGAVIALTGTLKSIGVFADGGFPTEGQLFIANEAGPEMVGTIGGHTAVANNDQIVTAIKQGVIEAMSESAVGGNWTIQVVDGNGRITATDVISAAQRKNIRDGKTVIQLG